MSVRSASVEMIKKYQPMDLATLSNEIAKAFESIRTHAMNTIEEGVAIAPTSASTQASDLTTAAGLDGEITGSVVAGSVVEVVSDDAGDTSVVVTVYGLDAAGLAQTEDITSDASNGTTPVAGTKVWSLICGASIAAAAGTFGVTRPSAGATIITGLATGTLTKGVDPTAITMNPNSVVRVYADGATVKKCIVVGTDAASAAQMEEFTLAGAGTIQGTKVFQALTLVISGDVEAARTITLEANKGATTWRINHSHIRAVVDGVVFEKVAHADYSIHATTGISRMTRTGYSVEAAIVIKNVAGMVSLEVVEGRADVTAAAVPPTDAEITAACGAGDEWVKFAELLLTRTGDTTVTQAQDNTTRPVLGLNTPYGIGDL